MKKFLINILKFSCSILLVMGLLIFGTYLFTRHTFDYSIPHNKHILILGDSQTQSAINDSILSQTYNLSQSGSSTFYTYVKAREVLKHNSQIDTLILSFSYGTIVQEQDLWFSGLDKLKFKIRDHFFLFNAEDYSDLFRSNPKDVLVNTPQVIVHNLKVLTRGYEAIGGFNKLSHDKLEIQKETLKLSDSVPYFSKLKPEQLKYSKYQIHYLLKTYQLCEEKGIQVVLINPPVHPIRAKELASFKNKYCELTTNEMPNAILINHFSIDIPETHFADLGHLNFKGSKMYSEFLKQRGLNKDLQSCE